MFRMLTEKTSKHFRYITVSGTHMGLLFITKLALYTVLALDQSEWIRAQDVDLTRLRLHYSLNFQFHACILTVFLC